MKKKFILLALSAIFLNACGSGEKTDSSAEENVNQPKDDTTKNAPSDNTQKATRIDSDDQRAFWHAVAEPILHKDKQKVLSTLEFPLASYGVMATSHKNEVEMVDALEKNDPQDYDRFFNEDFLKSLSAMSYKNISGYKFDNTIVYHLVLHRQDEGKDKTLELEFHKVGIAYKLKKVNVPGGEFYADHKKPS